MATTTTPLRMLDDMKVRIFSPLKLCAPSAAAILPLAGRHPLDRHYRHRPRGPTAVQCNKASATALDRVVDWR